MTLTTRFIAFVACALASAGMVQAQAPAKSPGCQGVQFSSEVLSRFPNAPNSCLDVITRDGQHYGVFKAQLESVNGNTLRIRVKNPDGTYGAAAKLVAKPGRKVMIDGKSYSVSELAPDQELTAYVRVDKAVVALPPAEASDPVETFPLAAPEQLASAETPVMPHTASPIGMVALLGQFCLATALTLMLIRRKRK